MPAFVGLAGMQTVLGRGCVMSSVCDTVRRRTPGDGGNSPKPPERKQHSRRTRPLPTQNWLNPSWPQGTRALKYYCCGTQAIILLAEWKDFSFRPSCPASLLKMDCSVLLPNENKRHSRMCWWRKKVGGCGGGRRRERLALLRKTTRAFCGFAQEMQQLD